MPPVIIAALIAAGATAASAAAGVGASVAASNAEKDSAQSALELQQRMWETQRADQAPWLEAGRSSLADLLKLQSDPNSIQNSPAFQFRLSEGQKALERGAAARGGLMSGRFAKGMARFGQGLASEEYGNQWNRLAGLAGVGQTSAQNLGMMGSNYANQATNLYGAMGNAQAAGANGIGGAVSGGLGTLGQMALGYGAHAQYQQPAIPTQNGMGAYGQANPYTTMIDPNTMPRGW